MVYNNIINDDYTKLIKSPSIIYLLKVELLDYFENPISEITNFISEDSAQLSTTYQQGVRKTFNCTLVDLFDTFSISQNNLNNFILQKIRVSFGVINKKYFKNQYPFIYNNLEDPLMANSTINLDYLTNILYSSNDDIYWFSKGIFFIQNIVINKAEGIKIISLTCIDKFGLFSGDLGYNELQGTYVINAGEPLIDALILLLTEDMGNGYPIDPKTPIFDPSIISEVSPYDINKGPGTYLGDLIIEIAMILGCDVYYNNEGYLVFEKGTIDYTYSNKSPSWEISQKDGNYISPSITYDWTQLANVVTVVGANANEEVFISTYENNNPQSEVRIELIGRKEKYIESSSVYNQERADDYAWYELNRLTKTYKTLSFDTIAIPHLEVNDVISLTDADLNEYNGRFIVTSIDYDFGQGTSVISGCNIADLPYYS